MRLLKIKKTFLILSLIYGVALCFSPSAHALEGWTTLARKVGQNESDTERMGAIKSLKKIQDLSQLLRLGLTTKDRPLALETISALNLKGLVPELLVQVPTDPDGFLTLAINSMTDLSNQERILKFYAENLEPKNQLKVSPPTIVAMLEPLGRLGYRLSRKTLTSLQSHRSPDVQSASLYYLRMMGLRNNVFENLDLVTDFTTAPQYQLRLQAISISAELISRSRNRAEVAKLRTRDELNELCRQERKPEMTESCLFFLSTAVAVKK